MERFRIILFFGCAFLSLNVLAQGKELIRLIDEVDAKPSILSFENSLQVNNKGGHLQGIQYMKFKRKDYYFVSGSSDSYSYFSVLRGNKRGTGVSDSQQLH